MTTGKVAHTVCVCMFSLRMVTVNSLFSSNNNSGSTCSNSSNSNINNRPNNSNE